MSDVHNPIEPTTGRPLAIPGCFCQDCEGIRAVAEFDLPAVSEDHHGNCGACHTYPCSCDALDRPDEYGQLIHQKQAIVQRQVDALVDTWISQYAWRADERPKMPKLRQMIAEFVGGAH